MEWNGKWTKGPPINLAWGPRRLNPALVGRKKMKNERLERIWERNKNGRKGKEGRKER